VFWLNNQFFASEISAWRSFRTWSEITSQIENVVQVLRRTGGSDRKTVKIALAALSNLACDAVSRGAMVAAGVVITFHEQFSRVRERHTGFSHTGSLRVDVSNLC